MNTFLYYTRLIKRNIIASLYDQSCVFTYLDQLETSLLLYGLIAKFHIGFSMHSIMLIFRVFWITIFNIGGWLKRKKGQHMQDRCMVSKNYLVIVGMKLSILQVYWKGPIFVFLCLISLKSPAPSRSGHVRIQTFLIKKIYIVF